MVKYFLEILMEFELIYNIIFVFIDIFEIIFKRQRFDSVVNSYEKNSNEYPFFWRILIKEIIFFSCVCVSVCAKFRKEIRFCLIARLQHSFYVLKDN